MSKIKKQNKLLEKLEKELKERKNLYTEQEMIDYGDYIHQQHKSFRTALKPKFWKKLNKRNETIKNNTKSN